MQKAILFFSVLFSLIDSITNLHAQESNPPKLVVGIVVDQMSYEYLYRYQQQFSENGFKKLMEKGANCRNALYNYVPTYTGPGHASVYTGTTPENHGIVANDWYDRETGKEINCVEDLNVKPVGSTSDDGLCSPKNLKTTTITDQLKMTYPEAKVISVSIKDRGAILPGGHLSNGSYWFDYRNGQFMTSSYYMNELPQWVNAYNQQHIPDSALNQTWNTYREIGTYKESGPDNSPYEYVLKGKNAPVFPYDLKEMRKNYDDYQLFAYTPFANTFLADFAIRALKEERLGKGAQTDMLCISFSTPDIAGHAFGQQSIELEDIYIRLDLEIAKLLHELEKQVGKNNFVLFLTADHAVVPVPQYLEDKKLPGGYVFLNDKMQELKQKVAEKYGTDLILTQTNLNIYLDYKRIDSLKINKDEVATFVALEVEKWEHVKRVFTGRQLLEAASDDEWRDMVRRGFYPSESGDVLFILEPGYLPKGSDSENARKGSSHGSAFNYDTHVPLLFYGKNIPKTAVYRPLVIPDITATLTHILNLPRTGAITGSPIVELLQGK